jgi:hypothetical protein
VVVVGSVRQNWKTVITFVRCCCRQQDFPFICVLILCTRLSLKKRNLVSTFQNTSMAAAASSSTATSVWVVFLGGTPSPPTKINIAACKDVDDMATAIIKQCPNQTKGFDGSQLSLILSESKDKPAQTDSPLDPRLSVASIKITDNLTLFVKTLGTSLQPTITAVEAASIQGELLRIARDHVKATREALFAENKNWQTELLKRSETLRVEERKIVAGMRGKIKPSREYSFFSLDVCMCISYVACVFCRSKFNKVYHYR